MGNGSCCAMRREPSRTEFVLASDRDMKSLAEEIKRSNSSTLRHVPEDSKAKNRSDKKSVVPGSIKKQPSQPLSDDYGRKGKPKSPPNCQLQSDRDWVVENYENHKETIELKDLKIKHNVCVRDCDGVTVKVNGKVNNASIDRCANTNIVLQDMISTVELIHCERTSVQVLGNAPSFAIDNSNGITLYLSAEGKNCKISTAKCGEINVSFPSSKNSDDWIEKPIPEQFVSVIKNDLIETTVSDLYS